MPEVNVEFTPIQRFWRMLKPDKKEIVNVYAYGIFNGIVYLSVPLGIQSIINLIQGGQINTSWIVLVMLVILGLIFMGVLQIFQLRITEDLQQKIFTRAAFEFSYRIPRFKLESIYNRYAPELMNRFFDIMSIQKGLSKILIDFSTAAMQMIFGLLLLSFYHPFFIMFSLVLLVFAFFIFRFTAEKGLNTSLLESKHKYEVAHWLEEVARTSTTFKLAGKTDLPMNRVNQHVTDYLAAREGHFRVLITQYYLMIVFKVIIAAGLLALGGILVMNQQMNIGQFVAAEIIILMVMNSTEKLILSFETIYDVLTSLEKVGQITDIEIEKEEGVELADFCSDKGLDVEVRDLTFSYPGQKPILKNISLKMCSCQKVVISGPNGAGKSTLLHVIGGLYDIQEGNLLYNKLPLGNLNAISLRSVIGDCLTHELLFQGSIIENIGMGREAANFENIRWAAESLGLEEYIQSLPKGYDTMIEPEGKKLPRSVVQKLLLARSIADKPKLLLLEDAFIYIDETERRSIIDFLTDSANPWTLIAASSDAYLAGKMDKVVIMKSGEIVNSGSFDEMKHLGSFKNLSYA